MWKRTITTAFLTIKRYNSNGVVWTAQNLTNRALLRVSGDKVSNFLQGLMTNDMRHLEQEGNQSMYCMFLNTAGRVLYDSIIYRDARDPTNYFIECDQLCSEALARHMAMYRVRRKIDIDIVDDHSIWILHSEALEETLPLVNQAMLASRDPRVPVLGWRCAIPKLQDLSKFAENVTMISSDNYRLRRFQLGVAEGVLSLPPGKLFPLESNCDYLHGVSFHKGCYIGQELTARTYHTGVTRKRIMPLVFHHKLPTEQVPKVGSMVRTISGNDAGKIQGIADDYQHAIGMLRVEESLTAEALEVGGHLAKTFRPFWWPVEAPKDRAALAENQKQE